jgi:hypothetical protein
MASIVRPAVTGHAAPAHRHDQRVAYVFETAGGGLRDRELEARQVAGAISSPR